MQHLHTNPKYRELLKRGYTHAQIAEMIQHCQQQSHLPQNTPSHGSSAYVPPPNSSTYTPPIQSNGTMGQYHHMQESRRFEAAYAHPHAQDAHHVIPRAPVHLQDKIDKSSMETVFQQAFQARQMDGGLSAEQHVPLLPENRTLPMHETSPSPTSFVAQAPKRTPVTSERHTAQTHRYEQYKAQLKQMENTESEAYALLQVQKDYDLRTLAKAYRKAALKYHPDRLKKHAEHLSTSQQAELHEMFGKVTKAYLFLMDRYERRQRDRSFDELKTDSREAFEAQRKQADTHQQQSQVRLMKGDKFDVELFNRIYNEHRLGDVYDDGHGSWLKSDVPETQKTETLFSGKFNQNVFNTTFEQLKREDPHAQKQLIKHEEPSALVLSSAASSVAQLGEDTVRDFGGTTGSLEFSDLKEAHTTNATLIHAQDVDVGTSFDNVKALQAHRSQLSHQRSESDLARDALRAREAQLAEEARKNRLARQDDLAAAQQARLGGLLTYGM